MEKKKYDVAVVIGRWQLPHLGHATLFDRALSVASRVIVVIGSAFRSRDTRQPFTATERQDMILASLEPADRERVTFLPVRDYYNDERWDAAVAAGVGKLTEHGERIALVGHKKDHTSYYLDRFSGWTPVHVEPEHSIDATSLRAMLLDSCDLDATFTLLAHYVKPAVLAYLRSWIHLPQYRDLTREYAAVAVCGKNYTAPWYMAADALVRIGDHVLLIRRAGAIGHGLWALPGGFVDAGEMFLPAALRELREETSFPFSASQMRRGLRSEATFGHPLRSPRSRIVSQAYYFVFGAMEHRPEVVPGDDAMEAKWFHVSELPALEPLLFEDHACILDHFVGLFPAD